MKNFKQIKSNTYAKMMRDLFPASFENEELNKILNEIVFDDEKTIFAENLKSQNKEIEFKNYIYSLLDIEKKDDKEIKVTAKELLDSVGYDLYEIKKPEDTEQFRKYFASNELICSYRKSDRGLSDYKVFFIVKKNIDEIKRSSTPKRQDEYGTSCCSIKISGSDLYITNRYNHSVNSPDNTFNSNLDNIVNGLTKAFQKDYGINLDFTKKTGFEMDNFVIKDSKIMYYNYEINNIYYGLNKYYNNGKMTILDTQEYILIDYYLISLKEHKIIKIDDNLTDGVFDLKFNKIVVKNNKDNLYDKEKDEEGVLVIYKD